MKISTCKFYKDLKLHKPVRQVQFCCLWKIYSYLLEIMLLPKTTNHFVSAPSFRPWLCWRHTYLYLSLKPGSLYSETYPPPPSRYLLILMLLVTLSRRKPLESIRDLGSWFDVHMRMDVHIGKICTTEDFSWTLQHQKGQKILSAQSSKTLVHRPLYLCTLTNYCNSHLFGLTNYQLDHL